jgi:hypothetical protein
MKQYWLQALNMKKYHVLSHRLLDFFSTAMSVQKIATKGSNSVYPSHMKKTYSVMMYIELKIVTVLSYFIFVYSMNSAYQYSRKIWFYVKTVRDKLL